MRYFDIHGFSQWTQRKERETERVRRDALRTRYRSSLRALRETLLVTLSILSTHLLYAQPLTISYNASSKPISFAVEKLKQSLEKTRQQLDIKVLVEATSMLNKDGYSINLINQKLQITSSNETGAMYGLLDIAEQIQMGKTVKTMTPKTVNPHFTVRAIKFNLPWSSYRAGPAMDQHMQLCRDLAFWQSFLDQMAENRFNVLSLWNVHPFSFMVKPKNFPNANNFSESEMREWKQFWTALFRMAKERGIEPFIVNWNIAVSPEFAKAYGVKERNDTSSIVRQYTPEVVAQVIDEYPDLAGIGITLADWMSNFKAANDNSVPDMTPKDREEWIEQTVITGIKEAKRPVKLLHRSVLSSDPAEMRRAINEADLPDTTLVEIKFNWSHGHSTPILALTHDSHSGKTDDGYWNPQPANYRIEWMIRNEDFFILRWGQADFIREHIRMNTHSWVNGYFVGSEGYIPALDFSHIDNNHRKWKYAFEKQWLFYKLWGRLLYDPNTPNEVFEEGFNMRYGNGKGPLLLKAYSYASQMPLMLSSFFASTWDYSLYSEGFLAPFAANAGLYDTVSSFISINELIDHPVLDPNYISIADYIKMMMSEHPYIAPDKISPMKLADSLEKNGKAAMKLVASMRKNASAALFCELDDVEAWSLLSFYFADKLRAGVALQMYRTRKVKTEQARAVKLLRQCVTYWEKLSLVTSSHYNEVPYIEGYKSPLNAFKDARYFSWSKFLPQVKKDIELANSK